jgi:hypothetical protein
MIYRVFSNYTLSEPRIKNAIKSWNNKNIINIPVEDFQLKRHIDGLPFLKDIIDIGYSKCTNDDDVILYTNTDVGLVEDFQNFPKQNFFSVRKNVKEIKNYKRDEIKDILYETVLCCDTFGITKKWYEQNKNNIPDFIIGSPSWDIAFLYIIDGIRLDNITFHVKHNPKWAVNLNNKIHVYNKYIFYNLLVKDGFDMHDIKNNKSAQFTKIPKEILEYFKQHKGFNYLHY